MYRLLDKTDFDKKFVELLSQLTETGNITKESFENQYESMSFNQYQRHQ